jgi:hypothetical protein
MVPKESRIFFQNNLEEGLRCKGRDKMDSCEKTWSWNGFFSSLRIFIPLSWEPLRVLLFLSLFQYLLFYFLFVFSSSVSLFWDFENIWGENKLQFFFGWDGSGYTMNMKVGQLRIYRWFTHTLKWTYACQYFWVRLANKISQRNKIDLKIFQNSKRTHPLTKLNTHKHCYTDNYLALVGI